MKKVLAIFSMLFISFCINAQDIETYYYSKDGKSVNKVFADYYRIVSVPSEINPEKLFRDFYMSGKIKGEGRYLSIDPFDANKIVFDGECVFYYENGKVDKKFCMINGKYNGPYIEFSPDGKEFIQCEYINGDFATDWYFKANSLGAFGRFKHKTNEPIYEEFNPEAQFITWIDGIPWQSYNYNGLTISMAVERSDEYGRYHKVSLIIDNKSFDDITFEPSTNITAGASFNTTNSIAHSFEKREVLSYDKYMQKVKNRQAWATIAMAVSNAASVVSSSFAPNSFSVSVNGSHTYINSYGNEIQIYSPDLAFAGVEEVWKSDRQIIQSGYLRRNTISSGSMVSGYFNIKKQDFYYIEVVYNYNGVKMPFYWNVKDDIAKPLLYRQIRRNSTQLTEYIGYHYKWKALHSNKIENIKIKNGTKITITQKDDVNIMKGSQFVIVDETGEYPVSNMLMDSDKVVLVLDNVDIKLPFSIKCKENGSLDFIQVESIK